MFEFTNERNIYIITDYFSQYIKGIYIKSYYFKNFKEITFSCNDKSNFELRIHDDNHIGIIHDSKEYHHFFDMYNISDIESGLKSHVRNYTINILIK